MSISQDSIAMASHNNIDDRFILNEVISGDSVVYDTTYPVIVTNVSGNIEYQFTTSIEDIIDHLIDPLQ